MNKKLVIVMMGAFIMASVVAMMVQASLAPKKTAVQAAQTGVEILVSNRAITSGEVVKAQDSEWKHFPEESVFQGMVRKPADGKEPEVLGKVLRRDLVRGEPITTQSVIMDMSSSSNNLSSKLNPGMRAIAVKVKADTSAGGFIAPEDNVDVILTYQLRLQGEVAQYSSDTLQKYASETLMKNIKVLAVDQDTKGKEYSAKVARTVTLEVTAGQAQTLSMASQMGEITLALRRIGEKDDDLASVDATTDVSGSKIINDIYQKMYKTKMKSSSVRIYNGNQITDMPVSSVSPELIDKGGR